MLGSGRVQRGGTSVGGIAKLFAGGDGKLRPIWRGILYFVLSVLIAQGLDLAAQPLADKLPLGNGFTAPGVAFGEGINFLVALIATGIFAIYERRSPFSYGLPLTRALGARTWEGALAGIAMAAAVGAGMFALGGMQVHGLATTGHALAMSALAWLGTNFAIGFAEEFWFRSYWLQTLWKAIGFWPASIVIALVFAAAHYFFKPGENVWDVITLVSLSMLLCYSVRRTGTLWFAVGFHMAFDYMQLFVIGTPNGGQVPAGRLLDATFNGPAWLTGGVLGTEASYLMYPAIALLWLYVWRRNRGRPDFTPA